MTVRENPSGAWRPLTVWTLAAFLIFAALAVWRTLDWSYGADTGTFMQLIANTPAGFRDSPEHGSHLRFHWSPVLGLLWPLVAIAPFALTLQLVQVAATVACAPLLYALLRPYTSPAIALRLAGIALLYPPLAALAFNEFHEVGLFAPLALGMLVAADRARWWWYAACVAALVTLREDVCLITAIAGAVLLAIALRGRYRGGAGLLDGTARAPRALGVAGAAAIVAGLGADAFYFGVVVPHLGRWEPSHFYDYPFANGPLAVAAAAFVHPLELGRAIATAGRFTYLLEALVPLALLPLRSRWSLLALPGFAVVLLSSNAMVWRMGFHYAALWIPYVLTGAGAALRTIERRAGTGVAQRWTNAALALCVVVLIAFNPMHPAHYLRPNYHALGDVRSALRCIPPAATVATTDEWYSAIVQRYRAATWETDDGAEYDLFAADDQSAVYRHLVRPRIEREVRAGTYRVVCRVGEVRVYRRSGVHGYETTAEHSASHT